MSRRNSRRAPTQETISTRTLTLLAILAATVGITSLAEAGGFGKACTSIGDLQCKVEQQGYKVQKAKIKNNCGELYATDKNGNRDLR